MPLSWNEIRHRAHGFAKEWKGETSEDAEAKTFWNEFFDVFGIRRRAVASFEEPVKNLAGNWSYIDLFWPSKLLVEHKSFGQSLTKANSQAMQYIRGLIDARRGSEVPQYVVVSDFENFAFYDLDAGTEVKFTLADFHKHIQLFGFIAGYTQQKIDPDNPLNIKAVELLGKLHEELEDGGYTGHDLERFLVRILFCLFADKTGIFDTPNAFALFLEDHTKDDGSDLGIHLDQFFRVLDQEKSKRQKNLDEDLASLPHVNGDLFHEKLGFADFNKKMRDELINCTRFDWSKISPAVFGSLFQSVLNPEERRQEGAHYTSEQDIMKIVCSLFLDDLRVEFERLKDNKNQLKDFHGRLAELRFLDPACGCGNFLVVAYRELRLLELEVLKKIFGKQKVIDIHKLSHVDVDSMYGIEISEFPARIAEVAMWLIDHQMNQMLSAAFGEYYARLPLKKSATIRHANALRIDWNDVLPVRQCSYILGNPPFVGKKARSPQKKEDMEIVFGNGSGIAELDYVCCWYGRAADYIDGTDIPVAFVSTNSITQGEQPSLLWPKLWAKNMRIHFAHRTFNWESEAQGAAHVHVVIIGFGQKDKAKKVIWDYDLDESKPAIVPATNINPYLIDGHNLFVISRRKSICSVPVIRFGNMPNDNGNFLFTQEEKNAFLKKYPQAKGLFRRFLSTREYLYNIPRWCLWLKDASPAAIKGIDGVNERVRNVKAFRAASGRAATKALANSPALFGEIRQPTTSYILIPRHTGETRRYIPLSYFDADEIVGDSCLFIADASLYHFGVLHSAMHMAWVRTVCGRIKSDFRYSNELVYNNYVWPNAPTDAQKKKVEEKAQQVLDCRQEFPNSSLAVLYDPIAMSAKLTKAHTALDRAVDACYRGQPFMTDRLRVEFLFELYENLTSPLTVAQKPTKKAKKS